MRWTTKSRIQNAISLLPSSLSYATYYWAQRHFGGLRKISPISRFQAAVSTWKLARELGHDPRDKVFLEVGTGRVPAAPLAHWLMGAKNTVTIDLNPYLRAELITDSLDYISVNIDEVFRVFGPLLDKSRFEYLLDFHKNKAFSIDSFLELCQVNYIAPGNAADTALQEQSIDFHTSYTVFEHIPSGILKAIVAEGNRLISDDGLFVHRIDYSDHFSHSDKEISAINFLRFTDSEWNRLAGNRYMYMNRLRHDDYLALFEASGHEILLSRPDVDKRALNLLRQGNFQVDDRFRLKSEQVLSITGSWIVSRKK
jgi:hypothetical protein